MLMRHKKPLRSQYRAMLETEAAAVFALPLEEAFKRLPKSGKK